MNGVVRLGVAGDRARVDVVERTYGIAELCGQIGIGAQRGPRCRPCLLILRYLLILMLLMVLLGRVPARWFVDGVCLLGGGWLLGGVWARRLIDLGGIHPSIMLVDA